MKALRRSLDLILGRRPRSMQVGAICRDSASGHVLMVTSRDSGRWVIPKGWPMEGRTLHGAAAQEAWEEAGVEGTVSPVELGRFSYDKGQAEGFSIPVEVRVFLLEVDRLANRYPEKTQRTRRWFTPADAAQSVAEPGLQAILKRLSDHKAPTPDARKVA